MAVIQKEIRLAGSKGEKKLLAVFDSGASYSCIQPELAEKLGTIEPLPEPMDFGTVESSGRQAPALRSVGVYPRHPEPIDFGTAESSGRQAPALRSVGVYPRQSCPIHWAAVPDKSGNSGF